MYPIELKLSAQYWRLCCHEADKIVSDDNHVEWYETTLAVMMGGEI